jgi:hypothetical protein
MAPDRVVADAAIKRLDDIRAFRRDHLSRSFGADS